VLSLVAAIALARLLTPEDFGVIAMIVPFVIVTNTMGNQGFQTALIQSHELTPEHASAFFWFAVRANLLLTVGLVGTGFVLARFYDEARVIPLAAAWGLLIWLLTLTSFQEAMLKRDMRFPIVLIIQLAGSGAGIACGIAAARLGAGHWAFFVQVIVVEIVRVPCVYLISGWRPGRSTARGGDGAAPLRSFWRSLAGFRIASWASEQPDRLLVGRLGGAPTLGIYDTAQRWSSYAFAEPFLALSDIAVASLSRVRHDPPQYRLFFAREVRAILTVSLPVIAFMVVEPASVVRVLLGPQWDAAVPFLRLLGVAAFVGSFTRLTQWVYFSSGTTDRLLRWSLLVQTPVLVAAVLAGSLHGPRGVAIGYAAATVALAIPSLAWCVSGTPLSLVAFLRAAARPTVAAVGAALLLVAAAPLLPREIGASRLAASLAVYGLCFLIGWFATPGGPGAARELIVAVRELRLRSES
jgi:PST family polysaccharide transporter